MRRLLPSLLAALALALMAPPAPAGAATTPSTPRTSGPAAALTTPPLAARFGRGFGRPSYRPSYRRPTYRRPAYRRSYRRPHIGHFFGNALRFLGIAYLAHMLFGLGAGGGSPFGLLIVLGVIAWLVSRSTRRRRYAAMRY